MSSQPALKQTNLNDTYLRGSLRPSQAVFNDGTYFRSTHFASSDLLERKTDNVRQGYLTTHIRKDKVQLSFSLMLLEQLQLNCSATVGKRVAFGSCLTAPVIEERDRLRSGPRLQSHTINFTCTNNFNFLLKRAWGKRS